MTIEPTVEADAHRIAAIRAREQAATKGPWEDHFGMILGAADPDPESEGEQDRVADVPQQTPRAAFNRAFIANARADVPFLLDRLEESETRAGNILSASNLEIERLRAALINVESWLVTARAAREAGDPQAVADEAYAHFTVREALGLK